MGPGTIDRTRERRERQTPPCASRSFASACWPFVFAIAILTQWNCTSSTGMCTIGMTSACACTDGRMGAQLCMANRALGPCECTGPQIDTGTETGVDAPTRDDVPIVDVVLPDTVTASDTGDASDAADADAEVRCMPATTRVCYSGPAATRGVGPCRDGMQTCDATGRWPAVCGGERIPLPGEICGNGVDDDCNRMVDGA